MTSISKQPLATEAIRDWMARLHEPQPEDIEMPSSSQNSSEKEYRGRGVDPKTASQKQLIGYAST
jgi:hypothetical protein